jgi:hypothetical protein
MSELEVRNTHIRGDVDPKSSQIIIPNHHSSIQSKVNGVAGDGL